MTRNHYFLAIFRPYTVLYTQITRFNRTVLLPSNIECRLKFLKIFKKKVFFLSRQIFSIFFLAKNCIFSMYEVSNNYSLKFLRYTKKFTLRMQGRLFFNKIVHTCFFSEFIFLRRSNDLISYQFSQTFQHRIIWVFENEWDFGIIYI